ncbi:MAG: hypothetical protein IPF56_00275 [Chloroflexi bacterium]|nr:hypothetical protein [Chloroflexota bacterium]
MLTMWATFSDQTTSGGEVSACTVATGSGGATTVEVETGEGVGLATAVLSNNGVAVAEGVGNGRSVGGADVVVGVGVGEETDVHPITPNNKIMIESSHTQRVIM